MTPRCLLALSLAWAFLAPAAADESANLLAAFFHPPPEFAGKLGEYRSPLLFADSTRVKSPEDWARRRKEIEKGLKAL